jgi:hypothetical protein
MAETVKKGKTKRTRWEDFGPRSGLTAKHWLALRNAPTRSGWATRQQYIRNEKEQVFSKLSTDPGLRGSVKLLLNTSHAQGMYDGLRDAWQLHNWALKQEFKLEKNIDERWRFVVPFIYRNDKATDEQICAYLDGEIERLTGTRGQPRPPEEWKQFSEPASPWLSVLRNPKSRQRVCSYMNRARQIARSNSYSLLQAWREIAGSEVRGQKHE